MPDLETARALAARMGYVLEQDFVAMCGVSETTVAAWRKRGKGPKFALVGCQYLYPEKDLAQWLKSKERESSAPRLPRDLL